MRRSATRDVAHSVPWVETHGYPHSIAPRWPAPGVRIYPEVIPYPARCGECSARSRLQITFWAGFAQPGTAKANSPAFQRWKPMANVASPGWDGRGPSQPRPFCRPGRDSICPTRHPTDELMGYSLSPGRAGFSWDCAAGADGGSSRARAERGSFAVLTEFLLASPVQSSLPP